MPTEYHKIANERRREASGVHNAKSGDKHRGSVGAQSFESEKTTIIVPESVVQSERKVEPAQFRESNDMFICDRSHPLADHGIQEHQNSFIGPFRA